MRLATIGRIFAYSILALVLAVVTYVFMMSGIYHTPESFLKPSSYVSPGGKILIVGGTRGTGLEIVKLLLERGEDITVTVRKTSNVDALNALGVKQVVADALIAEQVQSVIPQGEYRTVISTLGTSASDLPTRQNPIQGLIRGQTKMDPNKRPDFIGNRHVIDAAQAAGVERFIFVNVIGTGESFDALPLPARRGHNAVLPLKQRAEEHLRASDMKYTIIRPGGLSSGVSTGAAKLTEDPLSFSFISRIDAAKLVVAALGDPRTIDKTYTAYDPERRYLWKLFVD
jgi:uncharacterized protein YbjT (DUF2867 family)